MKKLKIISFLLTSFLFVACTTPSVSDFRDTEKPLAEDEYIVIWRFPNKPFFTESLKHTKDHYPAWEKAMAPIFEQTIPQIFTDVKNGKLQIQSTGIDVDAMDTAPIEDVLRAMQSPENHNANWQDIRPFQKAFHVVQRRKANKKGFKADELKIELVAADPEKFKPEKKFGFLFFEDLIELNYEIEVDGQTYDLLTYMEKVIEFAYPIYFKNHELDNGLRALDEAAFTKEFVMNGEWEKIQWLDGSPNMTDYIFEPLSAPKILEKYVGTYNLKLEDDTSQARGQIALEVRKNYLVSLFTLGKLADTEMSRYFPAKRGQFFSSFNDRIEFEELENGKIQLRIIPPDDYFDPAVLIGVME